MYHLPFPPFLETAIESVTAGDSNCIGGGQAVFAEAEPVTHSSQMDQSESQESATNQLAESSTNQEEDMSETGSSNQPIKHMEPMSQTP